MPDGDKNSSSPANGADIRPAILSGKTWNSLLDKIAKITPRGSDSVSVKPSTSGSQIASGSGGGELSTTLPSKVENDSAAVLISGSTWNNLLDYIESITPRGSASIKCQETPTGSILSFITLEAEVACDPGTFYVNVTVTGGDYPFTFAGAEWTASGQTRAVCGSGSQGDSIVSTFYGYPIYTFAGYQNWINSATTTGKVNLAVGGAGKGFVNPAIKLKKTNTPSAFTFYLQVGGFTFYGTPSTNLTTNNVASYSPAPASLFSEATSSRLTPIMFGSVTLTSGRVISWSPVPDLPWDYDNPPT